jgi:outer membrane lipoprotein SlyB
VNKVPQEAIAVGVAGAILGGITGRIVGFPALGTAIGAVSGAVSGARRIYDWKSTRGVGAFVLDHTWALELMRPLVRRSVGL